MEAELGAARQIDWNRWLPQSARQADHVCYSMFMVAALPRERERVEGELAYLACLESWLVHVRLLVEFLLIRPANQGKDFSTKDFGWDGSVSPENARLKEFWQLASSHLVHFSRDRTPDDVYDLEAEDTSLAALVEASSQLLTVAKQFVVHLEESGDDQAQQFREGLEEAWTALAGETQAPSQ